MGKCCTHCKKLLHPKNKTGLCLYCYNHPPFILKKCFVCGNDFKAKRTYTRYCSNYCSVQKTPEKYQEKIKQNKWVRYDFKIDRCCSYCGAKIKHKTSRMVRTKKSFCDFSCYRLFSKSNALRYYIPNFIPLTNAEHQALHNNESYYASKIVSIRGIEWFQDIERMKRTTVKTDRFFYMEHLEKLKAMLE